MDAVTYGSMIALAVILLTIYFVFKRNSSRHDNGALNDKANRDTQSNTASTISQRSTLKKESQSPKSKSQRHSSVEPASTLRTNQADKNSWSINGAANTFGAATPPSPFSSSSSSTTDSDLLFLLPTEADNSLNTRNAFKSPPGNLKIFSLYSDFVNEVSEDVQNVTKTSLNNINSLIDSDYHLIHDDEWRCVMEQNARLAQMTSRYVKKYRYPHYAGHIHQMLVTCLTTVTLATDLIDESFTNALNGETDQAKSKLKNSQVLLNKSPKYLEHCNSAMGACYVELSRYI